MAVNVREAHAINDVINRLANRFDTSGFLRRQRIITGLERLAESAHKQLQTGHNGESARALLEQSWPDEISPTTPAELSEWLRKWPRRTIFRDNNGTAWQRGYGQIAYYRDSESLAAEEDTEEYAALLSVATTDAMCIEPGATSLPALAMCAPFTVLALGEGYDEDES